LAPSERVRFTFSGAADGLLRDFRLKPEATTAAKVRAEEIVSELRFGRLDLYAGYGRVVWGRLDELQPTDVINPLDVSRFFFEGRSEARLPVTVVRARWFLSDDLSLEGVYVPLFRRGRFDRLEEESSPFNLVPPSVLTVPHERVEPARTFGNAQGGARINATTGRMDWSVSAYRGFEPFEIYALGPRGLEATFPRFTMLGGDFETVAGKWGVRGELAAFVRDNFQVESPVAPALLRGRSLDAGIGVDRKAGDFRVSGTMLVHEESTDDDSVSLMVSTDRSFARERYLLRAFGVYNVSEETSFARVIGTVKLRDAVSLEASGGWFTGVGRSTIGRFTDSDFVYLRLKYLF
jgi:hypothetical protein